MHVWCLWRPQEGVKSHRTRIIDSCETLCGHWTQVSGRADPALNYWEYLTTYLTPIALNSRNWPTVVGCLAFWEASAGWADQRSSFQGCWSQRDRCERMEKEWAATQCQKVEQKPWARELSLQDEVLLWKARQWERSVVSCRIGLCSHI